MKWSKTHFDWKIVIRFEITFNKDKRFGSRSGRMKAKSTIILFESSPSVGSVELLNEFSGSRGWVVDREGNCFLIYFLFPVPILLSFPSILLMYCFLIQKPFFLAQYLEPYPSVVNSLLVFQFLIHSIHSRPTSQLFQNLPHHQHSLKC